MSETSEGDQSLPVVDTLATPFKAFESYYLNKLAFAVDSALQPVYLIIEGIRQRGERTTVLTKARTGKMEELQVQESDWGIVAPGMIFVIASPTLTPSPVGRVILPQPFTYNHATENRTHNATAISLLTQGHIKRVLLIVEAIETDDSGRTIVMAGANEFHFPPEEWGHIKAGMGFIYAGSKLPYETEQRIFDGKNVKLLGIE
jgi:hypothetical protein